MVLIGEHLGGARSLNGYVDGDFVYENSSKKTLLACTRNISGRVVIPDSVTTIGECAFDSCENVTEIVIPDSVITISNSAFRSCKNITKIVIPDSVTSIGEYAFENCEKLKSIKLPNSIKRIRESTFGNSGLTSIIIPDSVTIIEKKAFYSCKNITEIDIPDSVTSIGEYAFAYCNDLKNVTVGEAVTSIGIYVFYSCSNLLSVSLPSSLERIGSYAFFGCSNLVNVKIPNGVTSIGNSVFSYCSNLVSIEIPNGVTSIPDYAFSNCDSLKEIALPNSIISIGVCSFGSCRSLTNILLSNKLETIGKNAFECCSNLKEITIPDSVKSIELYAFGSCYNLKDVTIGTGVEKIGNSAFINDSIKNVYIKSLKNWCNIIFTDMTSNPLSFSENFYVNGVLIKDLVITEDIQNVGNYAFRGYMNLRSVTINTGVKNIGVSAFSDCNSLTTVSIKKGLEKIGGSAFKNCPNLKTVNANSIKDWLGINFVDSYANPLSNQADLYVNKEIVDDVITPDGVSGVYNYAFYGCRSLKSVSLQKGVETIGDSAFENCKNIATIDIPQSVNYVGAAAFKNCEKLKNVQLPKDVNTINNYLFYGCNNLLDVTIMGDVTKIGDFSFGYCNQLRGIAIPVHVKSIGKNAFENCKSLRGVIVPDSVTSIGESAFATCTNLNHVVLSNSIKTIASELFRGCANLITVKVPSGVKTIEDSAFTYCGLETISIPNSLEFVYSWAFNDCSNLTDVYYSGSEHEWNNIDISFANDDLLSANIHFNSSYINSNVCQIDKINLVFNAMDAYTKSGTAFKSNSKNANLVNVNYTNTSTKDCKRISTYYTAIDLDEAKSGDMIFEKEDYQAYIIPKAVSETWVQYSHARDNILYFSKDKKDGKPYVSSVYARTETDNGNAIMQSPYRDAVNNSITISRGMKCDVIISSPQSNIASYVIQQDANHKIISTTGVFRQQDLYSALETKKPVYAFVIDKNNVYSEAVKIKLEKVASNNVDKMMDSTSISLFGKNGFNTSVSSSAPMFGGLNINYGYSSIPIGVQYTGTKVRISIGLNLFDNSSTTSIYGNKSITEKEWNSFKNDIKGLQKSVESSTDKMKTFNSFRKTHKYCKDIPKFGRKCSVDGSFMGYVEFDVADGDLVVVDICGQLAGEVAIQFKQQFFVLGFPVYVYEEAGGELSFAVEGAKSVPDNDFPMEFSATLKVEPYVKVGAGAGAKGYVSAGVAGKGSLPIEWVMSNKHIKIDVTGSLLIEGEFFGISGSLPILSGEYNLVDKYYGESTSSENGANYVLYTLDDEEDKPKATLSNRDYIKHTSDWLSQATFKSMSNKSRSKASNIVSNTLQEAVYKNSQVKIAKFDDTMMMVWIEDCKDRDTYNRYRLVYSVYDKSNKVWSAPNAVDDCGTMDYAPSLVSNGKDVYVAWQNINASVNKVDINNIISNAEIKLAKYDAQNDCFVDIQTITNNNSFDYVPNATFENGEIVVYYASCNNSDIGAEKSSSVKKFANNSTITVKSSLNFVSMLNTYGENYCFVSGGKLYNNRNAIELNEDMVIYAVYGQINGKIALFYGDAQGIHYIQDSKTVDLCTNNSVAGDFNVVEIGDSIRLLWNGVTESGSDLFSMEYVNGEWSSPIRLTEYDNNLSNVRAVGFDDSLYCVFDKTDDKNTVDDLTDDQTDLCTYTTTGFDSIDINLDFVDEYDFEEGKTVNITPVISNNGTDKIESITFEISDSNGYTKTVTKDVSILSGDLEAVDLQYDVPNDFDKSTISIVAKVNGENNEATDDGTIEVGFADLQMNELVVEEVEDTFVISGVVTNSNIVPAQDVVAEIYLGEEKSNLLEKSNLGVVEKNEGKTVIFTIPRDDLVFDNDGNCFVTFNVSTSSEEKLTDNNSSSANVHLYHNHNYLLVNDTSSCENDGFEKYRCESCDDEYEIEVKAKGHNYQISKPAKAPSCTENGNEEEQTCLNCGDVLGGSVIEPEGHNYQLSKPAKVPTCTEDGNEEEQICLNCGDVLGGNVIHCYGAHSFEWIRVNKSPTCIEDGEKSSYCSNCKQTFTEIIPASEKYHLFGNYKVTKEATCTEDGEKSLYCSICKKTIVEVIPSGHDIVKSNIINSETSYDEVTYCFRCGVELSRETISINLSDISLDETKTIDLDENISSVFFKFVAPENANYALFSTGENDTYCTLYDDNFNEIKSDDDGGYNNNFKIETSFEKGKTYYFECRAYQDSNISFNITLEKGHEHIFQIEYEDEATCQRGGMRSYYCTTCYYSFNEYIMPMGHKYEDDELYCLNGCGEINPYYNSDVKSISYKCAKPIKYIENANGWWNSCYDCEDGRYFYYSYREFGNGDVLTVNYKNGRSVDYIYNGDEFVNDTYGSIDYLDVSITENQHYKHWTVDGENYITYSYMNKEVKIPVTIIENPIDSVEFNQFSPIIVEQGVDSYESYDDNDELYDHYYYNVQDNATVTIHFKDGVTKSYSNTDEYDDFINEYFDGIDDGIDDGLISWSDEHYQYYSENHWYPGNTYAFIINIMGYEFTGYVSVTTHKHKYYCDYNEPTCTEMGYKWYYCDCGDCYVDDYEDSLGHSYKVVKSGKSPICTIDGYTEQKKCSRCSKLVGGTIIKATGHTSVTDKAVAPTCTKTGLTEGSHCSVCNAVTVPQNTVAAIGHSFGDNQQTCSLCGTANPNYKAPQQTQTPNTTPSVPADTTPSTPNVVAPETVTFGSETIAPNADGEYVSRKATKPVISKLVRASKSFKITWKKVKGVTGYQVQYSTSSKFTKKTSKKVTYKGNKSFTNTVKKLKGNKKYYVRVRTYKTVNGKKVYSAWSKAKAVTTKK